MKKIPIISFIAIGLLLTSCYSNYVSLGFTVHHGAVWNSDSSMIAFIASKSAYLNAKGISRFPDGGQPKYLMEDVGLYTLDIDNKIVNRLSDFNDLAGLLGTSRSNWRTSVAFYDSLILVKVLPLMDWEWYYEKSGSQVDSAQIQLLNKKYQSVIAFNKSGQVIKSDTSQFEKYLNNQATIRKVDLTRLNNLLQRVPLRELGLDIQKIYPKPEYDYIIETIYLKNESYLARRAVVEQIISNIDEEQIKKLLQKMDEYEKELDGYDQKLYKLNSTETRQLLLELLEQKK